MSRRRRASHLRPSAANGTTERHYSHTTPDSVALHGDPWAIGLAAITSTLHRLGVTHIRVHWWNPVIGRGERPPRHAAGWVVEAYEPDDTVTTIGAGFSTGMTTDHGVGVVEAGADLIRTIMERKGLRA